MDKLNANIEQSSRYCVHSCWMRNIVLGLPNCHISELAINTTVNVSTGQTPFMLVHRAEAKPPIDLALGTSERYFFINNLLTRSLSWLNKLVK